MRKLPDLSEILADAVSAPNCLVSGAGLYQATAGVQGIVSVQVADKYNNYYTTGDASTAGYLSLTLSGPASVSSSAGYYVSNGVYNIRYIASTATTSGAYYSVNVTYKGAQIQAFTNALQVLPGKLKRNWYLCNLVALPGHCVIGRRLSRGKHSTNLGSYVTGGSN